MNLDDDKICIGVQVLIHLSMFSKLVLHKIDVLSAEQVYLTPEL